MLSFPLRAEGPKVIGTSCKVFGKCGLEDLLQTLCHAPRAQLPPAGPALRGRTPPGKDMPPLSRTIYKACTKHLEPSPNLARCQGPEKKKPYTLIKKTHEALISIFGHSCKHRQGYSCFIVVSQEFP